MSELIQLQSSLSRIFREALPVSSSWENLKAVKNLQEINRKLDGVSSAPPSTSIAEVVTAYRLSQRVAKFRHLKYVCYGAAMQMQDGWCVLGDIELRRMLLAEVERLDKARQRLKCFEALLRSYFTFARYDEQTTNEAHNGWKILRDWLAGQRAQLQRDGVNKKLRPPGWFAVLTKHENLLTNKPCERYGADMLRGENSSIEEARQGLGIPGNSWVMEETILSQMRAAANLDEALFKAHLNQLLKVVLGQTSVVISELLKRRAIAVLVSRYARCTSKPEQPAMRDAAVSIIGNPWLKRAAWDAWVKKSEGQPDDEAREMVNGWLTRQLITDFFALLSSDGQADQRRLNYWLRFVSAIEGTPWLALGPDAMRNNTQPYRELRERAKGRLLRLENPGASSNNAFIMKMGEWLIVEFGVTGNACYVYPATPMPFSLGEMAISTHDLRDKIRGERLLHKDGLNSWESNFDQAICPKVGHFPSNKISTTYSQHAVQPNKSQIITSSARTALVKDFDEAKFLEQIKLYSLPIEDFRHKGGALWVCIEQSRYPMTDQWLEALGFKYKAGRGWWRE